MGNYFSSEYVDYVEKPNGAIAYTVAIAPQNSLPAPRFTQPPQRTTRFNWHFQMVERRRQEALEQKTEFCRANKDRADEAADRRVFRELASIDLV